MKYGILRYKNINCINIGDAIQILAIKKIYEKMNISPEEIVEIDYKDLQDYTGEDILLPLAFPLYGVNKDNCITCFSPHILPIFLALSILTQNLEEHDINYLKKFSPIGCRDEFTFLTLKKYGIPAYLNGCTTLTLENMVANNKKDTVYCVDVPEFFSQYIPDNYRQNLKYSSHIFKDIQGETVDFAYGLLTDYCNNAKLVITSRLHCAVPCYAMGIPVIFISSEFSCRYSWLEDLLTVYTPDKWHMIDWSGDCIRNNKKALFLKDMMLAVAMEKIGLAMKIYKISNMYNMRQKRAYTRGPITSTINYIENVWDRDSEFEYAVWGVTQVANELINYIQQNYPKAQLKWVIDQSKKKKFHGLTPVLYTDIDIKDIKDSFVFITADAANIFAADFFKRINKPFETYFMCWKNVICKNVENRGGGGIYQDFLLNTSNVGC